MPRFKYGCECDEKNCNFTFELTRKEYERLSGLGLVRHINCPGVKGVRVHGQSDSGEVVATGQKLVTINSPKISATAEKRMATNDKFCPNCGEFVGKIYERTGWCPACSIQDEIEHSPDGKSKAHATKVINDKKIGASKGTGMGASNSMSVLNEEQVLEIRARYVEGDISYTRLAAQYGVGRTTVRKIIARQSWKHI